MAVTNADQSFAGQFLVDLDEAVKKHTEQLIHTTTERQAGKVEGLQLAMRLMDERFKKLNEPRSKEPPHG